MIRNPRTFKPFVAAALMAAVALTAPVSAQEQDAEQAPVEQVEPAPMSLQDQILQETAMSGEGREDLNLKHRVDFFPSLDGKALALVVFEIGKADLLMGGAAPAEDPWADAAADAAAAGATTAGPTVKVFGTVTRQGAMGPETVHVFEADCPVSEADGDDFTSTHSTGFGLVPGAYTLTWGVLDEITGKAASRTEQIEVPNFLGGELMLTSVLATTSSEAQADQMRANAVYSGIKIGNLLFHDDLDRVFARDSNLEIVYAIMGAQMAPVEPPAPDPNAPPADPNAPPADPNAPPADPNAPPPPTPAPKPALEIQYRILTAETNQSLVRFPPMPLDRTTVGQPIPLGRIQNLEPGGRYSISITVKDTVSGNQVQTMLPFSIAEEAEEAPEQQ